MHFLNNSLDLTIWPSAVAVLTLLICMSADWIAPQLKLLDIPGGRKQHRDPTPLMGGVVLLAVLLPLMLFWALTGSSEAHRVSAVVALTVSGLALLGMIDDRQHLPATLRLAFCFVIILVALLVEPTLTIHAISWNGWQGGFGVGPFSVIGSLVCVVTLMNAANLADGKNGLLIGLCLTWSTMLLYYAPADLRTPLLMLIAMLFILLAFNLSGKLFLGDGGSYGLAALIGLLAMYVSRTSPSRISADQLGLMFMIPTGDMIRLMTVRIRRGQSPFVGDRDHLHHLLLDRFGWPGGLIVYLLAVLIPVLASIARPGRTLLVIAITLGFYFLFIWFAHRTAGVSALRTAERR